MNIKTRFIHLFLLLCIILTNIGVTTVAPVMAQSSPPQANGGRIGVVRGVGTTLMDVKNGQPADTLVAGALVFVLGRSADSSLLMVQTEAGATGWVSASALLVVDVAKLPVVDLPSASATNNPNETSNASESAGSSTTMTTTVINGKSITTTLPAKPTTATKPTTVTNPTTVLAANPPDDGSILATVQISALNLRSGPGTNYPVVGKTEQGVQWRAIGRNQTGDWVQMVAASGGDPVWAAARFLQVSAALTSLPIAQNMPAPPVVVQPTPGAAQASTTPTNTTSSAAVSPSGAPGAGRAGKTGLSGTLVFQDHGGGTIYVYDLGTDSLRPLTGGIDPAVSPDGKMVAFARDGGERGLYVINIDGSGERRIYNDQEFVRSPKWSPDGGKIVFSRTNGFEDCRVISGGHCLPDQAIFDSLPPELELPNMDVEKLVKDLPNYREYFYTLSRVDMNGGSYWDVPSKAAALSPDWSEDGIVYQSHSGIQRTSDAPNAESIEIRDDNVRGYLHDPDVQPGTGRIAFQRKGAGHWQIYLMNGDGSGMGAITRPVTALVDALPSNVSPAWSPDGQTIIYLSNRNSIESAGAWHLWAMNADGSNQRQLPIDVIFDYGFASEQMVSWGR